MNGKRNGGISIVLVIALLALAASGFAVYKVLQPAQTGAAPAGDIQYVLYLGTNDKDTYEPFGTPDACKAMADSVLTKHFEGFTIQDAMGGWTGEDGTVSHEYTVVIILSDTTPDKVHAAADELIAVFNQSSIMIQANQTKTEFYDGIQ